MNYCSNCGSKMNDDAKFCSHCGSIREEEPLINSNVVSQQESTLTLPKEEYNQNSYNMNIHNNIASEHKEVPVKDKRKNRSLLKSKAFMISASIILVIALLAGFAAFRYFKARSLYNAAISQLEQGKWADAKKSFEDAKKTGIIFYQDSTDVYNKNSSSLAEQQIEKAKSLLEQDNYSEAQKILADIPDNTSFSKDISDLKNSIDQKAQSELKDIDDLMSNGSFLSAKTELQKFMEAYNFGNYPELANQKMKDIDKGLSDAQAGTSDQTDTDTNLVQTDDAQTAIESLVQNYLNAWPEAVNSNNFSLVEPYLLKDSSLYNAQKSVLSNLADKNVKEELVDCKVLGYAPASGIGIYNVYVYEKYKITYSSGTQETLEYNWKYTVHSSPDWTLSDIAKDTTHNGNN
ncbi:MAG: zinc-ribbon domain-containing protein [Bacillota bacterium]|nr:zinc-ribbon domain-containing protein [Bacillota bacterium]